MFRILKAFLLLYSLTLLGCSATVSSLKKSTVYYLPTVISSTPYQEGVNPTIVLHTNQNTQRIDITLSNPTQFHMSLTHLTFEPGSKANVCELELSQPLNVPPYQQGVFALLSHEQFSACHPHYAGYRAISPTPNHRYSNVVIKGVATEISWTLGLSEHGDLYNSFFIYPH